MDILRDLEDGRQSTSSEDEYWSDEQEAILKKWGEESKSLSWMHTKCENWFNRADKIISLPSGILAILIGIAIFYIYDNVQAVKITFGTLSFMTGALSFARDYLEYGKRSARHGEAKNQYQILADIIESELTLDRSTRQNSKRFFKIIKERRIQLIIANYPPIINRYIKSYNSKYYTSGIYKPIITGNLTEIEVNRENYPHSGSDRLDPGTIDQIIDNENRNPAIQFELERYRDQG